MRKRKVFSFVFLSFLLLLLTRLHFVTIVEAQPEGIVVGVKVGDWVKYGHVSVKWNSTDPDAKPDQELIELNDTEWFKNAVTNVDYPRISFEHVRQLKDGSQETSVLEVNVESGSGNGTLYFILEGLFLGDLLYPDSIDLYPVFINITALRVSAGVTRLVNHLNLTKAQVIEGDTPQSIYVSINHYWDRETGILTERLGTFTNKTGSYQTYWTRSDKIVDTNLWSGEETERPVAVAGDNQTVYRDSTVEFNGNASGDNTGIVSYHWLFGDGTTGDGGRVTHVYDANGDFTVVLIVKDASGNMAWDVTMVTVKPPPPNGFPYEAIGAAAVIAVILAITWIIWSRKKRRIKVRRRHRASRSSVKQM